MGVRVQFAIGKSDSSCLVVAFANGCSTGITRDAQIVTPQVFVWNTLGLFLEE